ncbi:uncharacterized protein [Spinacia oleracea]|uniref:Uncharacterized protein isoform X1 n=1 Tax=Spinacia oleracea TaxID=3562 RepID=A0ABM3RLW0_SPIOL|nr:uncharacterized protein LOC110796451 isoform X1 [Spinacia oleracea]
MYCLFYQCQSFGSDFWYDRSRWKRGCGLKSTDILQRISIHKREGNNLYGYNDCSMYSTYSCHILPIVGRISYDFRFYLLLSLLAAAVTVCCCFRLLMLLFAAVTFTVLLYCCHCCMLSAVVVSVVSRTVVCLQLLAPVCYYYCCLFVVVLISMNLVV